MQVMGRVHDYVNMLRLKKLGTDRINNVMMPKLDGAAGQSQRAQAENEAKQAKIRTIVTKLKSGRRLTVSEMEYLRQNAPSIYEKAVKILKERDEYQLKLKRCKTKEQAQKLHLDKMHQLGTELKTAKGNESEVETIGMRLAAIQNEYGVFVAKGGLARLPREKELRDKERERTAEIRTARDRQSEEERFRDRTEAQKAKDDPKPVGDARVSEKAVRPAGETAPSAEAQEKRQLPAREPAEPDRRKKAVSAYRKALSQ